MTQQNKTTEPSAVDVVRIVNKQWEEIFRGHKGTMNKEVFLVNCQSVVAEVRAPLDKDIKWWKKEFTLMASVANDANKSLLEAEAEIERLRDACNKGLTDWETLSHDADRYVRERDAALADLEALKKFVEHDEDKLERLQYFMDIEKMKVDHVKALARVKELEAQPSEDVSTFGDTFENLEGDIKQLLEDAYRDLETLPMATIPPCPSDTEIERAMSETLGSCPIGDVIAIVHELWPSKAKGEKE